MGRGRLGSLGDVNIRHPVSLLVTNWSIQTYASSLVLHIWEKGDMSRRGRLGRKGILGATTPQHASHLTPCSSLSLPFSALPSIHSQPQVLLSLPNHDLCNIFSGGSEAYCSVYFWYAFFNIRKCVYLWNASSGINNRIGPSLFSTDTEWPGSDHGDQFTGSLHANLILLHIPHVSLQHMCILSVCTQSQSALIHANTFFL